MDSISYKIKIRASINGVEKIPSKIAWIQGNDECLLRPCYKENDYIIVELMPDCVGNACIEGWLIFDDTCSNCEPIHFKRCFCVNGECGDCEECVEGICQPLCVQGEYCLDNKCVECDPNNPCPNGKICINGKCVCPQGYFEKDGRCVQCDENTILNKCQECKNGLIIDKPCAGKCNPVTGDCIDCLTSGDCFNREDNKNCCNPDTKQCECCAGTVWNAEQGRCVPLLCTDDTDCGDPCLKCTVDGCQPMICPPGMKCWNGECVEWGCTNTTCNNGADCGDNCGCLNGECVPCYILECNGQCEAALGCQCNGTVCSPVDNCGGYCDGTTPCTDKNCTCYNNECVNCANFPCNPNDCSDRVNCGCSGGDCQGNGDDGCNTKLTLTKECGTNFTDCKLTAKLPDGGCKCDDIKFVTNSISNCTDSNTDIQLKVNLFKGNVNYNDFNNLVIGDNELITGTIKTIVTHYDSKGNLINVQITPVAIKSINSNTVEVIKLIKDVHYKTTYNNSGIVVNVKVLAENIQIPNNGCINYKTPKIIAEYNLNFKNAVLNNILCGVINSIDEKVTYVNDLTSTKIPLFVWSKTSTDFVATKFQDSGVYSDKGWFRKVYGTKTSSGYEDVINSVDQGLVNNYNYQVTVDCGCSRSAIHNSLDFCCMPDIVPTLSNCNSKFTLPSFKMCSVNGEISDNTVSDYNKAYYKLMIVHAGKDLVYKDLVFNNDKVSIQPFSYDSLGKGRIESITVIRYFKGGLLEGKLCKKELEVTKVNLPEVIYNTECDLTNSTYKVTVNQTQTQPKITKVYFNRETLQGLETTYAQSITMNNNSSKSIEIPIKKGNSGFIDFSKEKLTMTVNFENGCIDKYLLSSCNASLTIIYDPSQYSGKSCEPPAAGANIIAEVLGLSEVTYSINGGAYQTSNIFENLDAGKYIIRAKGIVLGKEVILEEEAIILPKKEVIVSFNPTTLCNGNSVLTIQGDINKQYTIKFPNGSTTTATTNNQGIYTHNNITLSGNYTVSNVSPSDEYCNISKILTIDSTGEHLNPQVTFQSGTYCVGQEIPFRIFDNNKNRSYNISSNTGDISPNPIQAIANGFNGIFTAASTNPPVITIQSSTNTCDTLTQGATSGNVTIVQGATIGTPTVSCANGQHTVSVTITGVNSGNVKIGGVQITPVGNLYTRSGIVNASSVIIEAYNGSCTTTKEVALQNCDCPNVTVGLSISVPTCGIGDQLITWSNLGVPPGFTGTYQFYEQTLDWGAMTGTGSSGAFPPADPFFFLQVSNNPPKSYKAIVTSTNGLCSYESNIVTTSYEEPLNNIYIKSTPPSPQSGDLVTLAVMNASNNATFLWSGAGVAGQTSRTVSVVIDSTSSFSCLVTEGTCTTNETITVTIDESCPFPPSIIGTINNLGSCQDPTVSGSGGRGMRTYIWSTDSNFGSILFTQDEVNGKSTLPGNLINPGDTVTLYVKVVDAHGCESNPANAQYTRCGLIGHDFEEGAKIVTSSCAEGRITISLASIAKLYYDCSKSQNYKLSLFFSDDLITPLASNLSLSKPLNNCELHTVGINFNKLLDSSYQGITKTFVVKIYESDGITQVGSNIVFAAHTIISC